MLICFTASLKENEENLDEKTNWYGLVLSFILIFTCSTTTFAADTTNTHSENLPHNGDSYFETEIRVDEEKNERIADFVTVYGYQYTQGNLKYGAWRNGASGDSKESQLLKPNIKSVIIHH